jgi:hypothetical protein
MIKDYKGYKMTTIEGMIKKEYKNQASRNPKLKKNGTSILKRMGAKLKELTNTK